MSTNNAIQKFIKLIYEKLDDGTPVMAAFLDLSKAFDTINHSKLISKLNQRYQRFSTKINKELP